MAVPEYDVDSGIHIADAERIKRGHIRCMKLTGKKVDQSGQRLFTSNDTVFVPSLKLYPDPNTPRANIGAITVNRSGHPRRFTNPVTVRLEKEQRNYGRRCW